jgi:hypothetical protein
MDSSASVIEDDVDKLIPLQRSVFAIPFGITMVTDEVLSQLKSAGESIRSPEEYQTLAETLVSTAWVKFEGRLAKSVDTNDPRLKAGVLIGGVITDRQFYVASMHGVGVSQAPILEADVQERLTVVGDDDGEVEGNFTHRYNTALARASWRGAAGPQNEVTRRILKVGIATIRDLSRRVSTVGGVIRYALIRRGYPVFRGKDPV